MTVQISGDTGVSLVQAGVVNSAALAAGAVGTAALAAAAVTPVKTSGFLLTQSSQTPLPGSAALLSFTHGLGYAPLAVEIEMVCLTAQAGFSAGDVVRNPGTGSGSLILPFSITVTATDVSARTGDGASFYLVNRTTGGYVTLTAASWAWRFKVRTA